jgi:hypothetical protein
MRTRTAPQPAIMDGFFIIFKPLDPGPHTIVVRGTNTFGADQEWRAATLRRADHRHRRAGDGREQLRDGLGQVLVESIRRGAAGGGAREHPALVGVVQTHVELVAGAELEQFAAHHQVRADTPAGVHLALALAGFQILAGSLEQDDEVFPGDHPQRRRRLDRRSPDLPGQIPGIHRGPFLMVQLVAEFEHRQRARLRLGHRASGAEQRDNGEAHTSFYHRGSDRGVRNRCPMVSHSSGPREHRADLLDTDFAVLARSMSQSCRGVRAPSRRPP